MTEAILLLSALNFLMACVGAWQRQYSVRHLRKKLNKGKS